MNAKLSDIFIAYGAFKRKRVKNNFVLMKEVLDQWILAKQKLKEKNKKESLLFRPFNLVKIGETTHSGILGELLRPNGNHAQGDLFLMSFLNMLGVPDPEQGKWVVTVEKWHIDILLRRIEPASVIIIENKSNYATDQKNQLYRYWYEMIHKNYPHLDYSKAETESAFKLVYLPPDSSKKPNTESLTRPQQWDTFSDLSRYPKIPLAVTETCSFCPDIVEWLTSMASSLDETNVRLKIFLEFYTEIWR